MWLLFNGSFSMNRLFFMSHLSTTFKDLLKVTKFNLGTPQSNQVVNLSWKKQFLHPPPGRPSSLWVVRYLEMQISFYRFTLPWGAAQSREKCNRRLNYRHWNWQQWLARGWFCRVEGKSPPANAGCWLAGWSHKVLEGCVSSRLLAGWDDMVSTLVEIAFIVFFFKTDDFFEKMGSTA